MFNPSTGEDPSETAVDLSLPPLSEIENIARSPDEGSLDVSRSEALEDPERLSKLQEESVG